jgi:hypothetical protein
MRKWLLTATTVLTGIAYAQDLPIEWIGYYGGTGNEFATRILPIDDDTYYLVGWTDTHTDPIFDNHPSGMGGFEFTADILVLKYSISNGVIWQKCLGSGSDESTADAAITADGGLILLANAAQAGGDVSYVHSSESDIWMIKLAENGQIEWERSYGGSGSEAGSSVHQTTDGGYLFSGIESSTDGDVSNPSAGDYDVWLVKTTANGTISWEKSIGGTTGSEWNPRTLIASDGSILLALSTESTDGIFALNHGSGDIFLLKLTSAGNLLWVQNYGGSQPEMARKIIQADGGYVIAGISYSDDGDIDNHHGTTAGSDIWIVRVDASGELLWQQSYGGSNTDVVTSILRSPDGNFVFSGSTESLDGDIAHYYGAGDALGMKISSTGELLWQNELWSTQNQQVLNDLCLTSTGQIVFFGSYEEPMINVSKYNFTLLRLSNTLSLEESLPANAVSPNPFTHELHIEAEAGSVLRVRLLDITGKELRGLQPEGQTSITIDQLDALPPGSYLLEITCKEGVVRRPVQKL